MKTWSLEGVGAIVDAGVWTPSARLWRDAAQAENSILYKTRAGTHSASQSCRHGNKRAPRAP